MVEQSKVNAIYQEMAKKIWTDTNLLFARLMIFQWFLAVTIAWFVSPSAWSGEESSIHIHVWAAVLIGGAIAGFTNIVTRAYSDKTFTRHLVAVAQMFMSVLIIHVSGGRIESHFHIFGSLAFLAFYLDPWVIITASLVTAADHYLRGVYFPMSAYGELSVGTWRWLEHGAWVIFEDVFLIYSCVKSTNTLKEIAMKQATLEDVNSKIEVEIVNRTAELEAQRERTLEGEKMAALGEMAAGMAHEINNPVAVIQITSEQMQDLLSDEQPDMPMIQDMNNNIQSMAARISKIVKGLKSFARNGEHDPMVQTSVFQIVDETLVLCQEKFRNRGVELRYEPIPKNIMLPCRSVQISQIVLNLLQNALDAVDELNEKWVSISYVEEHESLKLVITDSGNGIPEHIRDKILQPFFTTKEVGKGTGLGLSISKGIMEAHQGELMIDSKCANTRFILNFRREVHGNKVA